MRISDWSSDVCSSDLADASRGERLRLALQELGPLFVKFGQVLSTRRDLLPPDIADALALLQDRVAPFPGEQAEAEVEAALGKPVAELFARFQRTPLASASIAQVRSEEHTSELQSLMRISYAVFCLKKKNKPHKHTSI